MLEEELKTLKSDLKWQEDEKKRLSELKSDYEKQQATYRESIKKQYTVLSEYDSIESNLLSTEKRLVTDINNFTLELAQLNYDIEENNKALAQNKADFQVINDQYQECIKKLQECQDMSVVLQEQVVYLDNEIEIYKTRLYNCKNALNKCRTDYNKAVVDTNTETAAFTYTRKILPYRSCVFPMPAIPQCGATTDALAKQIDTITKDMLKETGACEEGDKFRTIVNGHFVKCGNGAKVACDASKIEQVCANVATKYKTSFDENNKFYLGAPNGLGKDGYVCNYIGTDGNAAATKTNNEEFVRWLNEGTTANNCENCALNNNGKVYCSCKWKSGGYVSVVHPVNGQNCSYDNGAINCTN